MAPACPCCGAPLKHGVVAPQDLPDRIGGGNAFRLIVECLAKRAGRVVIDDALIDHLYGLRADGGPEDARAVIRVVLCKLRHQLPQLGWRIETVWGVGYKLVVLPAFQGSPNDGG